MTNIRLNIKFIDKQKVVADIKGIKNIGIVAVDYGLAQQILDTENFLEKMLGLRVHIQFTEEQ